MKFYIVNDAYIQHLKKADEKVRENKSTRPYVGVVFEIDGIEFLAPLTSHKPKHDKIPANFPLIFKMHEVGNEDNKLGMVQLNNMIPVLDTEKVLLDIAAQSDKYRTLLNLQQQFLRKHKEALQKKAKKLYRIVSAGKAKGLISTCCDFHVLEQAMRDFEPKQTPSVSQEKLEALAAKFS
ncbi:TPA: type III toxin-antitoxin system ToxN/AbiQ family toxin [Vibrio parahaemolyticus]